MAYHMMKAAPLSVGSEKIFAFEEEVTLEAADTGDDVLVPDDVRGIALSLSFTGTATGKIEFTLSKVNTVQAGDGIWQDWDEGDITDQATTTAYLVPVTAFRVVMTGGTGTVTMAARAQ